MKKKILCIMISIVAMGACGCRMEQNKMELKRSNIYADTELTERQKSILEEQGLSSDVNDLTVSQIRAIMAIEEMLSYLENKYHEDFVYVGYTAAGNLEKESLRACVSGKDPQFDSFDVKKTDNGYEDGYMLVAIRDDYAEYVEGLLASKLETEKIKLFADIYTTDLTEIPEDKEDYDDTVSSWKAVFIYLSDKDEDAMAEYVRNVEEVLESKKLRYDCEVIFLKEDVVNELTSYNYMDYLSSEYYVERQTIEID